MAGLDPQIGIGKQPGQPQDADPATALGLKVTRYTNEKITSNESVKVAGAQGHGRLVALSYTIADPKTGALRPTELSELRFRTSRGVGYEVFVRGVQGDSDHYHLADVLSTVTGNP